MIYGLTIGGLGNQLFIIMATLGYCAKYNLIPRFTSMPDKRPTYWNTFLRHMAHLVNRPPPSLRYTEPSFNYVPIPRSNGTLILSGYFQSAKYFSNINPRKILNIPDQPIDKAFIHFRWGDYKHQQHNHPIQTEQYYLSAIQNFPDDTPYLIFCEKSDFLQIQHEYKTLFAKISWELAQAPTDYEELIMMANCTRGNIIANSTFSWWGAFLNGQKTIYPSKWFGPNLSNKDVSDLPLQGWIKI